MKDEYIKTLQWYHLTTQNTILAMDNDPKHASRQSQQTLNELGITILDWPAQSPDLNPIEHLWAFLKVRLNGYETPCKSISELWERVQVEWESIPREYCQKLVESMPDRIAAVLRARGKHTRF